MAFIPIYYPFDRHSVYRPVVYRLASTDYPVPSLFTAAQLIQTVRLPTPAEAILYSIAETTVVVEHPVAPEPFIQGETVAIPDTRGPDDVSGTSRYPGLYQIKRVISPNLFVINADYVGVDTIQGYISRVLGNYTVFARIYGPNIPTPVIIPLQPVLDPNAYGPGAAAYVFELDASDVLARHFKDIKTLIGPSSAAMTNAEGYISMKYSVDFYAGYDVVSTTGKVTFTTFSNIPFDFSFQIFDQVCVNAIHPYHQVERDGDVTLDYTNSFDTNYVMNPSLSGTPVASRRFLTYIDRDRNKVRDGDDMFLAFLWQGASTNLSMRVRFGDVNNTILSTVNVGNTTNALLGASSYIVNVGPNALGVPAGCTYYTVQLINATTSQGLSETFTFRYVKCKGINKRWYYLNKLGGIDAFTFEGEETREVGVERDVINKPSMRPPELTLGTFRHDWQRRVWQVRPDRKATITSLYVLPWEVKQAVEGMFESPNIFTEIRPGWWTNIIPITTEVAGDGSSARAERFVIQYRLGVDNASQRT